VQAGNIIENIIPKTFLNTSSLIVVHLPFQLPGGAIPEWLEIPIA
jgi:hypothetical protein